MKNGMSKGKGRMVGKKWNKVHSENQKQKTENDFSMFSYNYCYFVLHFSLLPSSTLLHSLFLHIDFLYEENMNPKTKKRHGYQMSPYFQKFIFTL